MEITINTTKEKVFKQYLTLINPTLGLNKLKPIEIEVLSKLLYIDSIYSHVPKEQRDIILFHSDTKKKIRQALLNMSTASFNNTLHKLRKKHMVKDNSLVAKIPLKDNQIDITFKFRVNE